MPHEAADTYQLCRVSVSHTTANYREDRRSDHDTWYFENIVAIMLYYTFVF